VTLPARRVALGLLFLAACAAPRVPKIPEGEEYLYPRPRAGELRAEDVRKAEKAWRDVLSGDTSSAESSYAQILRHQPANVAAETGFAYARLRAGRFREAREAFARALAVQPEYVPALVGDGSAAFQLGDSEAALVRFKRAEAAAPDEPLVRRRLGELKIQVTERRVAAAAAALAKGDQEGAIVQYRQALVAAPEIGGLRVDCANLLLAKGDLAGAIDVLRADPVQDRQVQLRLGELLAQAKQFGAALEAYRRILARDPRDREALHRAFEARSADELQGMPEEYRGITASPRIARADLAALVMVKIGALARAAKAEPEVAIDISGSWARSYILDALALDILSVYPNHTFQPGAIVRRGDLARTVARVLDLLNYPQAPPPNITDMSRTNLFYDAAARAVAAGLMDLSASGAFEAWRPVAGRDAADVIDALARLVGP